MPLWKTALLAACGCLALFVRPAPATTLQGEPSLVIAHRGASGYLPEHTLAGYELAIRMGADYIEPDLQMTSDGRLVAMHDETLARTTDVAALFGPRNGRHAVADFSLAEVKRLTVLPVGTAKTAYPGFAPVSVDPYKVPTFEEVIVLARAKSLETGRTIGLYPEAKQASPAMEDAILAALQAAGYRDGSQRLFIQSFSADTLRSIRAKQAALGLAFPLVQLGNFGADQLPAIAAYANGIGGSIGRPALDAAFIQAAHRLGLLVHGWTFADPDPGTALAQYRKYYAWGIDGVFTNYPDLALRARSTIP